MCGLWLALAARLMGFCSIEKVMVVGSGLGANQLVVFVNAMNEMGKIFESPVKLEKKLYQFEPMALAA